MRLCEVIEGLLVTKVSFEFAGFKDSTMVVRLGNYETGYSNGYTFQPEEVELAAWWLHDMARTHYPEYAAYAASRIPDAHH